MKVTFNRQWRVGNKKFKSEQEAQEWLDKSQGKVCESVEETLPEKELTLTRDFLGYQSSPTSNSSP